MQLVSLLPENPARLRRSTPGIAIATHGIEIETMSIVVATALMALATPSVVLDIQRISPRRFRQSCTHPLQILR